MDTINNNARTIDITGSVLGKPRHMINLATLSALKHREDMIKAAFYEAWSIRHFCSFSPGHSKGSFG